MAYRLGRSLYGAPEHQSGGPRWGCSGQVKAVRDLYNGGGMANPPIPFGGGSWRTDELVYSN